MKKRKWVKESSKSNLGKGSTTPVEEQVEGNHTNVGILYVSQTKGEKKGLEDEAKKRKSNGDKEPTEKLENEKIERKKQRKKKRKRWKSLRSWPKLKKRRGQTHKSTLLMSKDNPSSRTVWVNKVVLSYHKGKLRRLDHVSVASNIISLWNANLTGPPFIQSFAFESNQSRYDGLCWAGGEFGCYRDLP